MDDQNFFIRHKTKIIFSCIFGAIALLIVSVGFFKTVFVAVLAALGYFVGRIVEDKEFLRRFINNYLGK